MRTTCLKKTLLVKSVLPVCLLILASGCDRQQAIPRPGKVRFNIGTSTTPSGGRTAGVPKAVLLELSSAGGGNVLNETVSIFAFGTGYITDYLELPPSEYQLQSFLVADESNNIILVAPKKNSKMANYVKHPLPISFEVLQEKNVITDVEVLPANAPAMDFGYAAFSFNVVYPKMLKEMNFYQSSISETFPLYTYQFTYEGNRVSQMKEIGYDNNKNPLEQVHKYVYNSSGFVVTDFIYSAQNVLIGETNYEYAGEKFSKITMKSHNPESILSTYTFTYLSGSAAVIEITPSNTNASYVSKMELAFNDRGDITAYKNYLNTGMLNSGVDYKYDTHINPMYLIPFGNYNITLGGFQDPVLFPSYNVNEFYSYNFQQTFTNTIEYDGDDYPISKKLPNGDGTYSKITFQY